MKKVEKTRAGSKTVDLSGHVKIKTDGPLSEKDEVKQAEEKLRKSVRTRRELF